MIAGYGPVTQALLGTLLTWGLTAAGAACVIFLRGNQRKSLDAALAMDDIKTSMNGVVVDAAKSMDSFSDCLSAQHSHNEPRRRKKPSIDVECINHTYVTI
ncbi:Zinc transporter ZIP11 [Eumeta japonica]|uniref:Zinc transporter ZIP11 n=1 Tax=Eumeta variegata TaxID=151549 RepID=A0A4C1TJ29_EUMVA|nr:Zinc transporter ZIP11 [Eumeta japonica]